MGDCLAVEFLGWDFLRGYSLYLVWLFCLYHIQLVCQCPNFACISCLTSPRPERRARPGVRGGSIDRGYLFFKPSQGAAARLQARLNATHFAVAYMCVALSYD